MHHIVIPLSRPAAPNQGTSRNTYDLLTSASSITSADENEGINRIVLLTDKSCNITGLFHPPHKTYRSTTTTLFEACLPRSVTRISRGSIRPPWRRPCRDYTSSSPPPITGIITDDIIGTATDGTVYAFSILSQSALGLLRFLQNLIEAKRALDPETRMLTAMKRTGDLIDVFMNRREGEQDDGIVRLRDVDPKLGERGAARARMAHVDGDAVYRFLEHGAGIKDLVCERTEAEVKTLFEQLVRELRAHDAGTGASEGMDVEGGEEGAVEWVEAWIRDVLLPVL